MASTWDMFLWISSFLVLLEYGWSIKCLQCTSLLDRTRACTKGEVPAMDCPPDNHYCITYVGLVKSDAVVFRECNIKKIEHNCTIKIMEGQRIRVCYETCEVDSCNNGSAIPYATPQIRGNGSYYGNDANIPMPLLQQPNYAVFGALLVWLILWGVFLQ